MIILSLILIASILCGALYRAGGMDKEATTKPKWIPKWIRNTKTRDWGCPATLIGLLLLTNKLPINTFGWLMIGLSFGLMFAALTTYYDELFGYDNHYAHGFGCGLAGLLLVVIVPWWILLIRLVICTVGMGLFSKWIDNDVKEELTRGVLFIL